MNLLLDTHTFLWFVWEDPLLSSPAHVTIADPANRIFLSIASCWEIAIKVSIKKIDFGMEYQRFIETQLADNRFELLPIRPDHLQLISELPFHHRDPFDRMLAAQALRDDFPILSKDRVLDLYGVERIW